MAKSSTRRTSDSKPPQEPRSHPDDDTDCTPTIGIEPKVIDDEMIDLTVAFEMNPKSKTEGAKFATIHTSLLKTMQSEFEGDLVLFDNKNKKVKQIDIVEWNTSSIKHQTHFKIHSKTGDDRRNPKYIIIHRIRTNQTISTIRNHHAVAEILRNYPVYMRNHAWAETEWDTIQTGFAPNINPQYYTAERATALFLAKIKSGTNLRMPPMKMIITTPKIKLKNKMFRSKAFTIEVQRSDATQAMTTLKTAFRSNPRGWVAAKMRYVNPKAFAAAIHYQNTCLANNYVVQLTHITEEQMSNLREPMCQNIPGIFDIVDTKHTPTTGRYNVMVYKDTFKKVREYLTTNLQEMINTYVPEDTPSHDDGLPSVMMNDNGDDDSSGDESYLSLSAASFASIDISVVSGDTPGEFETKNKNRSWADVVSKQDASHLPPERESASVPRQAESVSDMSEITAELDSIKGQIIGLTGLPAAHLKMTQDVAALSLKLDQIFEYIIQQKSTKNTTPMSKTLEDEGQELDPNTQDMDEEMIPAPLGIMEDDGSSSTDSQTGSNKRQDTSASPPTKAKSKKPPKQNFR